MAKPDRIFASELLEREVMDLRAGEIVGAVTDFNVTREGVVTQLGVLPLQWYRGGRGIAPGAITNVTRERVSIEDSTLLDEFGPDGETSLSAMLGDNLYGKQVLQADGELLGALADFAFDLEDGHITDIVVFGDDDKRTKIGVDQVQTIGKSYIIISRAGAAAEVQPGPKPAATGKADTPVRKPAQTASAPPVAAANVVEVEKPVGQTAKSRIEAEVSPVPPIVEETGPPVARPADPKTATGRRSRASGSTATGRSSRPAEASTGRSSRPRTVSRKPEQQLEFSPEAATPAAAPESLDGLGLSTFDRRKAEYLLGKPAHREIRGGDGKVLLASGAPFSVGGISALMEQGMLNSVFLEMTQHKSS